MAATTSDPLAALAMRALDFVGDGVVVGLGSGRAASAFVRALAARVRDGLRVRGVPTSEETARLALNPALRTHEERPFVTDNCNVIIDCAVGPIEDPAALQRVILAIPGVIDTGLFLATADTVLVSDGETVRELVRRRSP